MKTRFFSFLITFAFSLIALNVYASEKVTVQSIDWEKFLSKHDMFWDQITPDYYTGAIMGNGLLGTNFYKSGTSYRFNIGRIDVTENRNRLSDSEYPKVDNLYDDARLPIGYFLLNPVGSISSEMMRLSLYDAINKGSISTDKGRINFKSYVHAEKNYILFETEASAAEVDYTWTWNAQKAISPRTKASVSRPANYSEYTSRPNPEVRISKEGDYNLSVQELLSGLTYVVAWKEVKNGNKRRIIMTVSQEEGIDEAIASAKQTIDECLATDIVSLEASHKNWWNNYYPASFVSFANSKMESFYWAQIYKFACTTRPDKLITDLQGPWATDNTPWPAIWLNLNVQLTYSWMYAANRSDYSLPLWKALEDNIENLKNNVHDPAWRDEAITVGRSTSYSFKSLLDPSLASVNQYETGNMTWILFNYWQYCTYNNKQKELTDKFFPLLKKSIAYYFFIREKGADGKYHLPMTASPEYLPASDCNYDLALLRWGLQTLLTINKEYDLKDEKQTDWEDFLANLVDYPVDETRGYMIGKGVNLTSSHRHYSHLMMIYPLYTVNWEQVEKQNLITKSINNWQSMTSYLQGYSFTGSSAMYSSMGDGERAVAQLQKLLSGYIKPNTLYAETGPVIETPFAAVASLHDLYLQSWGGKIRVFHAVPSSWEKASFINLRTEGAFLVSASREKGKTVFIQVESEAGGKCRLQTEMDLSTIQVKALSGRDIAFTSIDVTKGLIEFDTNMGDVIQITDSNIPIVLPGAIEHPLEEANPYGVNSGPEIPVEGIRLPSEVTISTENPTVVLIPEFIPSAAKNRNTIWESSDEKIVKVRNGALIPYSKGEATVTVTTEDGGFQATCKVMVIDNFQAYVSTCIADSYVRGGSYSNTNYGTENLVVVKKDESAGYDRLGYLKFSIGDLDEIDIENSNITISANIYINSTGNSGNTANIQVYAVESDWTEAGINYSNKPANGELLETIPGFLITSTDYKPENTILLDLTKHALDEYAKGNKTISIHLFQDKRGSGGGGTVNFASKEHEDTRRHPTITILAHGKTTGIDGLLQENSIGIYPTWVRDEINVSSKQSATVNVYSIDNKLIQSHDLTDAGIHTINMSSYLPGIYVIQLEDKVFRIIKQ